MVADIVTHKKAREKLSTALKCQWFIQARRANISFFGSCSSRFHWLCPLESKHSTGKKRELKKIYFVNDFHKRLQNGIVENLRNMQGNSVPSIKLKWCNINLTTHKHRVKSSPHTTYYVKKFIMIWQRKESMELFEQSNYPIMLDA